MPRHDSSESAATTLWRTAKSAPLLSAEVEGRLAREAQAGSQRAFDELLTAHLRLVLTFAHKFTSYGAPLQDLISEGMLGLVEAARRFDPDRGARFSTYAGWWMHAYMRRYTITNRRLVPAPTTRHGRKLMAKLRTTQRELAQRTGEAPDAHAVAEVLGVGVSDVEEMEAALSGRDISYGADADGHSWELPTEDHSPEQLVADAEERAVCGGAIAQVMGSLRDRERQIVEQRHFGEEVSSFAAMGRDLGLSRERVRQLSERATAKIRDAVLAVVA